MVLFTPGAVADALREERLSEADKVKYLIGGSLLTLILGTPGVWSGSLDIASVFAAMVYMSLFVAGILLCYDANRRGDDRHFIERFVCLAFVVSLLWCAVVYSLYFLAFWVAAHAYGWSYQVFGASTRRLTAVLFVGAQIAYYLWLRRYIVRAAAGAVTAGTAGARGDPELTSESRDDTGFGRQESDDEQHHRNP